MRMQGFFCVHTHAGLLLPRVTRLFRSKAENLFAIDAFANHGVLEQVHP
jgi:hypothetical protein